MKENLNFFYKNLKEQLLQQVIVLNKTKEMYDTQVQIFNGREGFNGLTKNNSKTKNENRNRNLVLHYRLK